VAKVPFAMTIDLTPIGYVSSSREDLSDDGWGDVQAMIELTAEYDVEAFDGIEEFSHVEVVYFFDRVPDEVIERGARHPRENAEWPKVGIFAQRGKDRPNRLGVSIAKLVKREGRKIVVQGLDAIHRTPVLDIKPVMLEFLPTGEVCQPAWSHEIMRRYWR